MSIFLRLSDRYKHALETFDPLAGEPLFGVLDPWPSTEEVASPRWTRLGLFVLFTYFPIWLLSAIPSVTAGGNLFGTVKKGLVQNDGLVRDIVTYSILLFVVVVIPLIVIARRLLGALINEVVLMGIAGREILLFSPRSRDNSVTLRILEWVSRLSIPRSIIWWLTCQALDALIYRSLMSDSISRWTFAEASRGTPFFFLHVGSGQPNMAGLWTFLVLFPMTVYLLLPILRLIVLFACLCSELARSENLRITPAHPDGTGGLKPIGEIALFFTLFFFAIGLNLMGGSVNELLMKSGAGHISKNWVPILIQWVLYVLMGSMLFFLPLIPLRAQMAAAKRQYLLESLAMKASAEKKFEAEMKEGVFRPEISQGLVALDLQIQSATEMAIWPFDRKTFVRYAGLFISPLAPFVVDHLPEALKHVKEWALSAPK